jgi:hypothetical protein
MTMKLFTTVDDIDLLYKTGHFRPEYVLHLITENKISSHFLEIEVHNSFSLLLTKTERYNGNAEPNKQICKRNSHPISIRFHSNIIPTSKPRPSTFSSLKVFRPKFCVH